MSSDKKGRNGFLTIKDACGLKRAQIRQLYSRYVNPSLVGVMGLLDFDKNFIRAQGVSVWDGDGKHYLDFLGGYGALNLGHNPPEVQEAIREVSSRPNIIQASLNSMAAALAHNLAQVAPGDLERVFFCNSGTEAVEGALKLARAANAGRKKIIYCNNAFHGKTFGSLSVTGREKYQKPFAPLLADCEQIPFDDLEALEQKLREGGTAAFIVEPIQGEGGVNVPREGYLRSARELCSRYGTLLIVDEVQTGLGRTGYLFACEREGVVPDILCLAKSLGGGIMPLGAYIARPGVWDKAYSGMDKYALHTSTFGGNTVAMAAGMAALNSIIDQELPKQAGEKGQYFLTKLQELADKYKLIKEVRGRGLLIGLEFNQVAGKVLDKITAGSVNRLAEEYLGVMVAGKLLNGHGIITAYTLNNPNVIRLEPPLTVAYEEIDRVVRAIDEILGESGLSGVVLGSVRAVVSSILGLSKS
jgi:putrescine aminotransferase